MSTENGLNGEILHRCLPPTQNGQAATDDENSHPLSGTVLIMCKDESGSSLSWYQFYDTSIQWFKRCIITPVLLYFYQPKIFHQIHPVCDEQLLVPVSLWFAFYSVRVEKLTRWSDQDLCAIIVGHRRRFLCLNQTNWTLPRGERLKHVDKNTPCKPWKWKSLWHKRKGSSSGQHGHLMTIHH